MSGRIRRTRSELLAELAEQLNLLRRYCEAYDAGEHLMHKPISVSLRVMLNETTNQRSLLEQLGMRSTSRFLDAAGDVNPRNLLPESKLTYMVIKSDSISWSPKLNDSRVSRRIPFSDWWSMPVIRIPNVRTFSRMDLVLSVANKDGGAHVDPEIPEDYFRISRANALGWVMYVDGKEVPMGNPIPACIRQIGHECMETVSRLTAK
jgi:hypothetical protein